jgi:hypothetical protein
MIAVGRCAAVLRTLQGKGSARGAAPRSIISGAQRRAMSTRAAPVAPAALSSVNKWIRSQRKIVCFSPHGAAGGRARQ